MPARAKAINIKLELMKDYVRPIAPIKVLMSKVMLISQLIYKLAGCFSIQCPTA